MIVIAMVFILLMYALLSACIIYAGGKVAGWLGYDPIITKKRIKIIWFAPVLIWLVWDLPTIPLHRYYCATQAGFFVYKSPEQWLKEHPEVTKEDLRPLGDVGWNGKFHLGKSQYIEKREKAGISAKHIYWYNRRIYLDDEFERFAWFPIMKYTNNYKDSKTGEVLAKSVKFSSGYAPALTAGGISGFKEWLKRQPCDGFYISKSDYIQQLQRLGEQHD